MLHLFIGHGAAHVCQVAADVIHVCVAKKDLSKVLFADGGHAFGVGEELDLK